jgi:hypothetical protein
MLRLDNIKAWKLLADGKFNAALYRAVLNRLDWSLLQFVMKNYEQPLVRDFIRFCLFENEKAIRLLLDNLQGKKKEVHRFIMNTRYRTETREFLLRNLSDHRVRRFLLEIWDEENVCLIVLNNLVPDYSDYEEYEDFSSAARNFILENLDHEAVRQSVLDRLDEEVVLRYLLLDNLHHKAVERFVAERLHEAALQHLLHGFFTDFREGFDPLRERRKRAVRQFLLSNLHHEPVLRFVLNNSEIVPEPYWYSGMTREDGQLLIVLRVKDHSFCKLLLDINTEPVTALLLSDYSPTKSHPLHKETVQQIILDNIGDFVVAQFVRKNISWLEEFLLENSENKQVLEFMKRWVHHRDPLPEDYARRWISKMRRHGLLDWVLKSL